MATELWGRARNRVAEHLSEDLAIPTEGIFAETDRRLLELLIRASDKRIAVPNEILINSGDRDDTLFVLLRGDVEITKESSPGIRPFSRIVTSPNVFGEACALGLRHVRTATVRALTVCDLRLIPGVQLQGITAKFRKDVQHLRRESQARLDEQCAWVEKGKCLRLCKTWRAPEELEEQPDPPTANSTAAPSQLSSEQASRRTSGISCVTDHLSAPSCSETPCDTPKRSSSVSGDGEHRSKTASARIADRYVQDPVRQHRSRRTHTQSGSGWSYERGRLKGEAPELPSAWMRSGDALTEAVPQSADGASSLSEADTPSHSVSTPRLPALPLTNERAASHSVERQKAAELSAAVGAVGSKRGRPRRSRHVKTSVAGVYGDSRQHSKESRSLSSHASSTAIGVCDGWDSWEPSRSGSCSRGFAQVEEQTVLDAASAVAEVHLARQSKTKSFGRGRPNTPTKQSTQQIGSEQGEEARAQVSCMARSASAGGAEHGEVAGVLAQAHSRKGRSQLQNRHPLELVQRMHHSRGCGGKNRSVPSFSEGNSPREVMSSFSTPVSPTGHSSGPSSPTDTESEEGTDRVPSPSQVLTSKPRAASSRTRVLHRGPREGWQKSLCQHVAVCYPSALPTKDTFGQRKVPRPVSPDASSSLASGPDTAQGRGRQPFVESEGASPRGAEAEPDMFQTLLARHLEAGRGRQSADESDSPHAVQASQEMSPTRPLPHPPPGRRPGRDVVRGRRLSGGTSASTSDSAVLS